jgi:hypothetical protein
MYQPFPTTHSKQSEVLMTANITQHLQTSAIWGKEAYVIKYYVQTCLEAYVIQCIL